MNGGGGRRTPRRPPVPPNDYRTARERVEDSAFQARLETLARDRKWAEYALVMAAYGSALSERPEGHLGAGVFP